MSNAASFHRRVACVGTLVLLALIGCGGSHGGSGGDDGSTNTNYTFNDSSLGCDDSLDITIGSGTFPTGSTVTFQNSSTDAQYDGSAVSLNSGKVLDCGFPSGAPLGTYEVLLNGKKIGVVKNNCKPS